MGIGGAIVIVLVLSAGVGWVIRRGLLSEVQEVSRTASAIVEGDLTTHQIALDEAPKAYETFQKKEDGAIKYVIKP